LSKLINGVAKRKKFMSNLLKSKFLMGVLVVAAVLVGVAAVAPSADAASCTITMTLRQGSTGTEVMCLQSLVGASPDGKFGPMTAAAVKVWQSSHGLVPDAIVGPMTRAALMNSPVIGALPAGCQPGWLFNPNTGASCNPSTVTPPPSGTLQGGAGSIDDAQFISSVSNEDVGEGEDDVQVLGLDVDADDGSDLALKAIKVEFEEQGAGGSEDLDDYADSVSVWLGSKKLGEADVADFNEDNGVWSKTINLSGENVIDAGDTGKLYVAVTALSNIDSSDLGSANNDWNVTVDSLRFEDAAGAIVTDSSTGDIGVARDFQFESFSSATDTELKLTEATTNPDAQVVEVDDTDTTDVVLVSGNLEAKGSDIEVKEMTVDVTSTGDDPDKVANNYSLWIDGEEVQSLDAGDCDVQAECDGDATVDTTATYVFDDVDFSMDAGDKVKVEVKAEVAGTDDSAEGVSLAATLDNDNTQAEDVNGDDLSASDLTGIITGEEQTFYSEGINVTLVSTDESKSSGAAATIPDVGTYTIKFKVTAFGSNMYVNAACDETGSFVASDGVEFDLTGGNTYSDCSVASTADTTGNGNFEILEGTSETVTLTVAATGADAFSRVKLLGFEWENADSAPADANTYSSNLDEFETDDLYLASN
jgi:peptidoglycan hydrolase-like protein with peptidoglycan-binding domain